MDPTRLGPPPNPPGWPNDNVPTSIGGHQIAARLALGRTTDVFLAMARGPFGFVRPVVVKRLRREWVVDPTHIPSIAREAIAYARLNHPSIVRLYEFVEHEGQCALVLEYVSGLALSQLLAHQRLRSETMSDRVALYIMWHVFSALAAAHAARDPTTFEFAPITHRDVSPKNVLLDWEGIVKLTDFGIAKLTGVESDTRDGVIKGTYGYMAPEQVLGDRITIRTDVYSACLLLRELLLGRHTFSRVRAGELELLQAMAAPILEPIETLRDGVPPTVAQALRVGLALEADRRDITAAEIRDILAKAIDVEAARTELATLLSNVRATRNPPSAEQTYTTEPRLVAHSAMTPREPIPAAPILRVPIGDSPRIPASDAPVARALRSARPDAPGPIKPRTMAALVFCAACAGVFLGVAAWRFPFVTSAEGFDAGTFEAVATNDAGTTQVTAAQVPNEPAPAETVPGAHALAPPPPAATTEPARPSGTTPPPAPTPAAPLAPERSPFGTLVTQTRSHDHRIYIDGRVVGTTGQAIQVRCGAHRARYGSKGRWQEIDVPCGGEVTLLPRW